MIRCSASLKSSGSSGPSGTVPKIGDATERDSAGTGSGMDSGMGVGLDPAYRCRAWLIVRLDSFYQ
ncbi:MAG TPA: hypothetical protein VHN80_26120 [Kineosporiaceae bacterium]|nr:hypothetical protein [Kineosporiaceae bacterium]